MIRGSILAFVAGWFLWFWIDKSPLALGPPPHPSGGGMLGDFQLAVDLLREGRVRAAYVYIWQAHYIVLSLGGGLLAALVTESLSRALARRRLRRLYIPDRKKAAAHEGRPQGLDDARKNDQPE
ncbi:MAG TPA: hypothetical protein ENK05_00610 [Gammaproteobacteria bacterium]|nr:hypothetical protein [Gammaproteobacteria bacterium]